MSDNKARWVYGILLGLIVTLASMGYADVSGRIAHNEAKIEQLAPVLYRLEEYAKNNREDIQENKVLLKEILQELKELR